MSLLEIPQIERKWGTGKVAGVALGAAAAVGVAATAVFSPTAAASISEKMWKAGSLARDSGVMALLRPSPASMATAPDVMDSVSELLKRKKNEEEAIEPTSKTFKNTCGEMKNALMDVGGFAALCVHTAAKYWIQSSTKTLKEAFSISEVDSMANKLLKRRNSEPESSLPETSLDGVSGKATQPGKLMTP